MGNWCHTEKLRPSFSEPEPRQNRASQIVQETRGNDAFAWPGAANVSRPYAVNGLNQYVSVGPNPYTYDANGNLISDGLTNYVYDVENRLVGASNGAALVYDPLGRLFQTSGGTAGTTEFLYDGDSLIAEYNGSGALLRRYLHGPGVDEPLIWYEGADLTTNRRRLQADRQGSIVSVSDTTGAILAINAYDPWGVPKAGAAPNQGRFQYTGQAWIGELGMYYYKARIYSPMLGRFMQTDPVGYKDDINLYAYVANDPINGTDPTGMAGECDTGSRIGGNSGGCRVAEGYGIQQRGAEQGRGLGGPHRSEGLGTRIINAMRRDPDVRRSMALAWIRSGGDGRTGGKNEHGFWVKKNGGDLIAGRMITGEGPRIYLRSIENAHSEMPGARIFFHTHPFRVGELPSIRSLGISDADRGVAIRFDSVVVSLARQAPYTTYNFVFDAEDNFYTGR